LGLVSLATLSMIFTLPGQLRAAESRLMNAVVQQLAWKDMQISLEMRLERPGESALIKEIDVYLRDRADGQDLMNVFTAPSNMKGTAFLANCNQDLSDKWYIYLRTIRRVKRMPPSPENFMLRDFLSLYLLKPRLELWDFTENGEVQVEGQKWLKVTATAKTKTSTNLTGYDQLIYFIDPQNKIIMKTEFYHGGKLVRKQQTLKVDKINGAFFPFESVTDDLSEKVSARIIWKKVSMNAGIEESIFTPRNLKTF
jgi:hypothetical protein